MAGSDHLLDGPFGAGEQRFDRAVPSIAHPPAQPSTASLLDRPGAKPDALDPSLDPYSRAGVGHRQKVAEAGRMGESAP